ncbi:DUF1697 domain-containing protein [Candidatus Gracilibacteria bacterium]|nr:DUF1697 domain-containing protein [Candidatus Gracilibacteria bacterium]
MQKYVALLRGINVGGNKKVPMADLKKCLEKLDFKNIKTLLNSGNVVFEGAKSDEKKLIKKLEAALEEKFNFTVPVILRTAEEIEKLIKTDPFQNIHVDKNTRLYITFLAEKSTSAMGIPYESSKKEFRILEKTNRELFSILQLSPSTKTTELMSIIEKEFGKNVTTRNWNTVLKIAEL